MFEKILDEIIRDMVKDEIKAQLTQMNTFELRKMIREKADNIIKQSMLDKKTEEVRLVQR